MAEKKEGGIKSIEGEVTFLLVGLFLLSILIARLYAYFSSVDLPFDTLVGFLVNVLWPIWKVLAVLITFAAIVGIFRINAKMRALNEEENKIFGHETTPLSLGAESQPKNEKWEHIVELVNSANPSDWRLAIIEADVMLEDFMRRAGYHGETLGEMLKGAGKNDFTSLDEAWEAHKIRNNIAHQGREFALNEREAKHALSLFEKVFKEFGAI